MCPFGVNDGCTVYLDESLRRFDTVFPVCGSSNSAIELTPDELEKLTREALGLMYANYQPIANSENG